MMRRWAGCRAPTNRASRCNIEIPKMMADFLATARYVRNCPDSAGKLGAVGFYRVEILINGKLAETREFKVEK